MEEKYLIALENTLLQFYEPRAFCLHGYQEESGCLEKQGDKWIVFHGERGCKHFTVTVDTIELAAIEFFKMMTRDDEKIFKMTQTLHAEIEKLM